jgi:hypothetical protein
MGPPVRKRKAEAQQPTEADAAFPRGGAQLLTPLERRQIEEEAKQALELEEAATAARSKDTAGNARKRHASRKACTSHCLRLLQRLQFTGRCLTLGCS